VLLDGRNGSGGLAVAVLVREIPLWRAETFPALSLWFLWQLAPLAGERLHAWTRVSAMLDAVGAKQAVVQVEQV